MLRKGSKHSASDNNDVSAINQFLIAVDAVIGAIHTANSNIKSNSLCRYDLNLDSDRYFNQPAIEHHLTKNYREYKQIHERLIYALSRVGVVNEELLNQFKEVGRETYIVRDDGKREFNLKRERLIFKLESIFSLLIHFKFAANYLLHKKVKTDMASQQKHRARYAELSRDFLSIKERVDENIKIINQMLARFPASLNTSIKLLDQENQLEKKAKEINAHPAPIVIVERDEKPATLASASSTLFNTAKTFKETVAELTGNRHVEPLFTDAEKEAISAIRTVLNNEYNSPWPFPNKDKKLHKIAALDKLTIKTYDSASQTRKDAVNRAIDEIKIEYPDVEDGDNSTRVANLLKDLRSGAVSNNIGNRI